jgi:hypothetical protein
MTPTANSIRLRFAAWMLLLVYGLSLPGVVSAVLVSLAEISAEHEVQVVFHDGHLDIVLHHHDERHEQVHHGLAKLITGLSSHHLAGDHVLHFATTSESPFPSRAALHRAAAALPSLPWQGVSTHPARLVCEAMPTHAARPPPLTSSVLVCLRTTVLVV